MKINTNAQYSQLLDLANLNGMQVENNSEGLSPELMELLSQTPKEKNFSEVLAQQAPVNNQHQISTLEEVVVTEDPVISQDLLSDRLVKKPLVQPDSKVEGEVSNKFALLRPNQASERTTAILNKDNQLSQEYIPNLSNSNNPEQVSHVETYQVIEANQIDPQFSKQRVVNEQTQGHLNQKFPVEKIEKEVIISNDELLNQDRLVQENISKSVESEKSIFNKQRIKTSRDNELLTPKLINKNAEDASKQFNPVRKSIFDVNRPVATNNVVKSDFEQVNKAVIQKQSLPYEQQQSSIFKKDLKSKVSEIAKPRPENNIMDFMLQQDIKAMDRHIQMPVNNSNLELATQTASAGAVLELDTLSSTNDRAAVIDQIQNYIVQAKATNQPKVQMSFHHQELGVVDLNVEKAQMGQVNISITTNSSEGMKFFNQHQSDLLGTLSNSGIKVSEFKLDSNTQGDLSQNNSQQQGHSQHTHHRNQDSKRREELWNLFKQHRDAA